MLWTGILHTFHSAEKRTVSYYHELVADRRRGPGTEEGIEKGSGDRGQGRAWTKRKLGTEGRAGTEGRVENKACRDRGEGVGGGEGGDMADTEGSTEGRVEAEGRPRDRGEGGGDRGEDREGRDRQRGGQ